MRSLLTPLLALCALGLLAGEARDDEGEKLKTGNHMVDRYLDSEVAEERVFAALSLHQAELRRRRQEATERLAADPAVAAALDAVVAAEEACSTRLRADPGYAAAAADLAKVQAEQQELYRSLRRNPGEMADFRQQRDALQARMTKAQALVDTAAAEVADLETLRAARTAAADAALKVYRERVLADPECRALAAEYDAVSARLQDLSREMREARRMLEEKKKRAADEAQIEKNAPDEF